MWQRGLVWAVTGLFVAAGVVVGATALAGGMLFAGMLVAAMVGEIVG